MKKYCIVTAWAIACFFFSLKAFAAGEIKLLENFAQCYDKKTKHTGGVLESPEQFVAWLNDRIFDGAHEALRIIDDNSINFENQVVVWVIGRESKDYYDLMLKTSSFDGRVLKTVLSEQNQRDNIGNTRQIQGQTVTRNPLYIYVTDPRTLRIKSEDGDRLLKRVEFYQNGQSAPFSTWGIE